MKYLSLKIGGEVIQAPNTVPTGGVGTLNKVLGVGLGVLMVIGILVAGFYLIWGGYNWITSGGDKQKVDNARKQVIWSILGLIILVLSLIIINFFGQLLGSPFFGKTP